MLDSQISESPDDPGPLALIIPRTGLLAIRIEIETAQILELWVLGFSCYGPLKKDKKRGFLKYV